MTFELKERPAFKVGDFVDHIEGYGPYRILAPKPRIGGWQEECGGSDHPGQTHLLWTAQKLTNGTIKIWCDSVFALIKAAQAPVDESMMAAKLKAFIERCGEDDAREIFGL